MSNWDDEEEYNAPVRNNFEDEDEDDVVDDWEAAESSEDENKPAAPTRKRVGIEQRIAEREAKEQTEREKAALELAEADEATKKQLRKQAEIESDLTNAATLFSSIDIHPRSLATQASSGTATPAGPAKLSDLAIFKPTTKQEFDNLRKTLAPLLCELAEVSSLQYGNFVTELCRDVCKAASIDQIRKVSSTLNALTNEKVREERANRGKKKKPVAKAASQKIDEAKDVTNYDDFEDDDFM
ncbi:eukaryotic translation initiation factor 3 subunit J [Trichomonascus vanleenenianus]|uniref:translation initiation factor eIF3 core subunit j n=1 Tax=Trichomonascus vanleenenianus TaxID=2268995 RepID=UPI003ECB22A3